MRANCSLLDIGHFESEQFTSDLIRDFLIKKFPNFAVLLAQTVSNPIKYYLIMANVVEERLRALTRLQVIDSKLDEIHRLRGSLPEEVSDLEDDLEGLETRKQRIEEEIKRLNQEIAERQNKIKDFRDQIKKYESQQMDVKNNREYEALRKEIEYANLEILTSEKKIRQFGEQIENKEELLNQTSGRVEDKKQELAEKQKELEVIISDTKTEEKKLLSIQGEVSEKIEGRIRTGYQKVRHNMRNGLAVVTTDRGACGGCFSIIPPQVHLDLSRRERLIHCENCGRILVDPAFFEEVMGEMHEAVKA